MSEQTNGTFQELLERNRPRLIRICRIYGNQREDQEDLFQEIAYQIWRSMNNFRGEAQIDTFLYRIALNTALVYKAKQKKKQHEVDLSKVEPPAYQMDIADQLDKEDKISWLYTAIRELNTIEQSLILLYLEEMSYEEIAKITGLTINHVGVKINRIKKKLSNKVNINS